MTGVFIYTLLGNIDFGFQVDYILQDGGEENRQFIKLQFLSDLRKASYESTNLLYFLIKTMVHCQDYSLIMKKMRNSVLHSESRRESTLKAHCK